MAEQSYDSKDIFDYLIKVQGIGNTVAKMLGDALSEQDAALLAMIHGEVRTLREMIISNKHPKIILDRLQLFNNRVHEHLLPCLEKAYNIIQAEAGGLADITSQSTAQEIKAIQKARKKERDIRKRNNLKERLSKEEIKDMLNYKPFVDGKTIGQWFDDLKYNEAARIFRSVQKGIIEGMTLHGIMGEVRGKMAENQRSREMLARTVINATANQSRLAMFQANADVIDGVQWRSTLDHRTCMICGAYDGKIWTPDKMHEVKVPPAHPSCRCVLLPYIDGDLGGTRPAEAENFDLIAKEKYEAKYEGKKYDDLSYEYRRKLRYKAIEEYTESGKKPYKQVPSGTTFADYLKGQPDEFQQEWLGKYRYEKYKEGKLPLEYMVKPDNEFKKTVEDLKEEFGEADILLVSPVPEVMSVAPASPDTSIVNYEWEKNPLVQQELAKNKALNESYDSQLQALESRATVAREEMKTKFPYMVERTGAIKDWMDAERDDRDAVRKIWLKLQNIDSDKYRLEQSIMSDATIKRQNEAIVQALFPKFAATNLTDTEKRIMDKFTMLTTGEQKDALEKMLRMSKMFGVDLEQFAKDVQAKTLRSNQARGSVTTRKRVDGTRTLVSVNFQQGILSDVVFHEFGHVIEVVACPEIQSQYKDLTKGKANKKITRFSGRKDLDQGSYKDLPFSYPQSSFAVQYFAKTYKTGETELMSGFFECLFTDAKSLLQKHSDYVKLILGELEK